MGKVDYICLSLIGLACVFNGMMKRHKVLRMSYSGWDGVLVVSDHVSVDMVMFRSIYAAIKWSCLGAVPGILIGRII